MSDGNIRVVHPARCNLNGDLRQINITCIRKDLMVVTINAVEVAKFRAAITVCVIGTITRRSTYLICELEFP